MATQTDTHITFLSKGRNFRLIRLAARRRTGDGEAYTTNGLVYDFSPDGFYTATGARPCANVRCESFAQEHHDEEDCPDCERKLAKPDYEWLRSHRLLQTLPAQGLQQVHGGAFIEIGDPEADAERNDPSRALMRIIDLQAKGDLEGLEALYAEETNGYNREMVVQAAEGAIAAVGE